jgi:hypothetical protein
MFSALGDFPTPGDASGSEVGHDTGREAGVDARHDASLDVRNESRTDTGLVPDSGAGGDATMDGCGQGDASDAGAPEVAIVDAAFFVAPDGSDDQPGTLTHPFATLTRAQQAMQMSDGGVKTTYIRKGSYTLPTNQCGGTCGLNLGFSDDGETWSYYPPDGVDLADLSGGSTSADSGVSVAISVGASHITITGLVIHNFSYAAISSGGGADNLTVENSIFYNGYVSDGDSNPGAISCYGCAQLTVSHNIIHDIAQFGVSVSEANNQPISGLLVTGNVFYNTCNAASICSAVYLSDLLASSTNIQLTNNYIRDGNTSASTGTGESAAIIATNCTSNVTASGNVITGKNGANAILVQGGMNIRLLGNLTDLGSTGADIASYQSIGGCTTPMSENVYENSIIIGNGAGGGYSSSGSSANLPLITHNDYYSYGDAGIISSGTGDYSDSKPSRLNPQLSGWDYKIACGSPVLTSPVSFPPLVEGWGPPGYVLPDAGTPPSSPH